MKSVRFILAICCTTAIAATSFGDLIISEYVEGSSNNKAIELFNTGTTNVDLSTVGLSIFANGSGTGTSVITVGEISGMLIPGAVFSIAHTSWSLGGTINKSDGALSFNGNDAVVLFKTSLIPANYLDVIGQIGNDPGTEWGSGLQSTADNTLRRNVNIVTGDTNGADTFTPSVQWRGFATDQHNLGSHDGNFSVAAVPEPTAFLFGGLACVGIGFGVYGRRLMAWWKA